MAKKVLFFSDSLHNHSGLAKAMIQLMDGMYKSGNYVLSYVVVSGADSSKNDYVLYDRKYKSLFDNLSIYNCQLFSNALEFDKVISKVSPDIVISCTDPWNLDQIFYSNYRSNFYWIHYGLYETSSYPEYLQLRTPIKNDIPRRNIAEILRSADLNIPVTKMGCEVLDQLFIKHTNNVYLGLDLKTASKTNKTKSQIFGKEVKDDDFIFMTVGKNTERKKLDLVLESFARFLKSKKDKEKYKLYLHTDINEVCGGTDLLMLILTLDLKDNVILPSCFLTNSVLKEDELYDRYKVSDCYIGLSGGEGFGFGFAEAILHRKPVIYSNEGGHVEYCYGCGYPVKSNNHIYARNIIMSWNISDIDDAAYKMEIVAANSNKNNFDKNFEITLDKLNLENNVKLFIKTIEDNYKEKFNFNFKRVI